MMEDHHPTSAQNRIIRSPRTPSFDEQQHQQQQKSQLFATSHTSDHPKQQQTKEQEEVIVRIGVVPEHFSTPFHIGTEHKIFEKHGLVQQCVDVIEHPRGTGSMCKALRENRLDVAIALTEGLLSDMVHHQGVVHDDQNDSNRFRICGTYVQSSLVWGIVTKHDSSTRIQSLGDLRNGRVGISRFGSGSHIMSYLLAEREHWYTSSTKQQHDATNMENTGNDTKKDKSLLSVQFVPCGGLDDLRRALVTEETIDTFLWESFMLKHHVDAGEMRMVGTIETPWPCFMIAVRDEFAREHAPQLNALLDAIQECCQLFYVNREESLRFISQSCHLSMTDAERWFRMVRFAPNVRQVSETVLCDTIHVLQRIGVLEQWKQQMDMDSIYNREFYKPQASNISVNK